MGKLHCSMEQGKQGGKWVGQWKKGEMGKIMGGKGEIGKLMKKYGGAF